MNAQFKNNLLAAYDLAINDNVSEEVVRHHIQDKYDVIFTDWNESLGRFTNITTIITKSDIKEGAKFHTERGIVWIIDQIDGDLVRTSMEHGSKGNYRDYLSDVVDFLNEKKAEKISS